MRPLTARVSGSGATNAARGLSSLTVSRATWATSRSAPSANGESKSKGVLGYDFVQLIEDFSNLVFKPRNVRWPQVSVAQAFLTPTPKSRGGPRRMGRKLSNHLAKVFDGPLF